MLSTIITLLSGLLGIFWSIKARNSFTRLTGLLLSVSFIFTVVHYAGFNLYAFYSTSLFCLMAAYEPLDSSRIKKKHRAYFAFSGFLMALVTVDIYLKLPFPLTLWPFVGLFMLFTCWFIINEPKIMRSRLSYICVWMGLGLICLIRAI